MGKEIEMARTFRFDNGLNKGRDDKPMGSRCGPDSGHPKGYNSFEDDHGHYGTGGARSMKRQSHRAARIYNKRVVQQEVFWLKQFGEL